MTFRSEFVAGTRDILPFLPGFFSFGVVAGYAAINVGLSWVQAVAMSVIVYSGAGQLAALELLANGAPGVIIVFTALIVNVRFMMFSASIAPHLRRLSMAWKAALAYFLITPNFVLSVARFEAGQTTSRRGYYLGASVPFWLTWQAATITGILFGPRIPDVLQVEFVVPLAFIALLVPELTSRTKTVTAVAAGIVVVGASGLPFQLGVVVAALAGTGVGMAVQWSEHS